MARSYRHDARRRHPTAYRPIGMSPLRTLAPSSRGQGRRRLRSVVGAGLVVAAAGGVVAFQRFTGPAVEGTSSGLASSAAKVAGTTVPPLIVPAQVAPSVPGFISSLRGLAEPTVSLTANGGAVTLDAGGGFEVLIPQAWTEIRLVATDSTGTTTEALVTITADPTPADHPITSAVHVTAGGWGDTEIRERVLALVADGLINAVQLDIKNERGEVGYASNVLLAETSGAVTARYDAREALDELHAAGVRVIGRIVNFLDPNLAAWALANGRTDMIVLDELGAPLAGDYGTAAFTNLANPEVRQYQIDLAAEAAALGFDEVLYDYVRRPDGDVSTMRFPGLAVPPDVSLARFVAETRARLAGTDTMLGISVFGISASRSEPTAQDLGLLAPSVDYVAPMVYPSHWGAGEYGVADPSRQPAEIVSASLADFQRAVAGTGAAIVPWLQDFDSGDVVYGDGEVRAQIDAAMATGSSGFLLWNPDSTYHRDALPLASKP